MEWILKLYYDFLRIGQSFISSYAQSYTYGSNTITTYASQLFEIAIFALIYVNRNNAKWKYFYYPKVCWELIKLVLIGNRMGPISSLLAIYLLKTGLIKKGKPDTYRTFADYQELGDTCCFILSETKRDLRLKHFLSKNRATKALFVLFVTTFFKKVFKLPSRRCSKTLFGDNPNMLIFPF